MTREEVREMWREAMVRNGHVPRLDDDGKIDMMAMFADFHNGPACDTCHMSWCEHCRGPDVVEPCDSPVIDGNTWLESPT